MVKSPFLTAREAAAELGVSRATLYAYVSRGLVRSEAGGGKQRDRRYWAEDIQRLKERKDLRRNPGKAAEDALSWGVPVLESGLTFISNGRLFYRGQDTSDLTLHRSLEEVASLLWTGGTGSLLPEGGESVYQPFQSSNFQRANLSCIQAFQMALIQAESQDPAAFDRRPESAAQKGFLILHLFARIAAGINPKAGTRIAEILQSGWAPSKPEAKQLINAALILCADHELNVSAFTVRCVASAGSSPYAAVTAGLAALQGVKHGGATLRVEALFQEIGDPSRAQAVLAARLKRGESIPGFGHPLYPEGDPRARLLLELLQNIAEPNQLEMAQAIAGKARRLIGELPTIDFALVSLARALDLPEDSPLTLFAIGRTVGWIAHTIEQYRMDKLIRPRARYIGRQP